METAYRSDKYTVSIGGILPRKRIRPVQTNKRIEIKAVQLKDKTEGLYWRWRWQDITGQRFSSYGGRIDTLNNKARLQQYWRNRRRYRRRRLEDCDA